MLRKGGFLLLGLAKQQFSGTIAPPLQTISVGGENIQCSFTRECPNTAQCSRAAVFAHSTHFLEVTVCGFII
jgi:hypothetical protein